jgi:hypothetical protein
MTTEKKLGIWMDHSSAHLIEFTGGQMETKTIESHFTHDDRQHTIARSEKGMHNKEQHEQSDYYKILGEAIVNFNDVILFGPTDAKVELLNVLREDHRFDKINIEIRQTDNMTEHQQQAFVREHFSRI